MAGAASRDAAAQKAVDRLRRQHEAKAKQIADYAAKAELHTSKLQAQADRLYREYEEAVVAKQQAELTLGNARSAQEEAAPVAIDVDAEEPTPPPAAPESQEATDALEDVLASDLERARIASLASYAAEQEQLRAAKATLAERVAADKQQLHEVPGDDSCLFHALAHQLARFGVEDTAAEVKVPPEFLKVVATQEAQVAAEAPLADLPVARAWVLALCSLVRVAVVSTSTPSCST